MLIRTDNPPWWLERFESNIEPEPNSGCWIWTGRQSETGEGEFWPQSMTHRLAHRLSWELTYGRIPFGQHVARTCRFRFCVNPTHLCLRTKQESFLAASSRWVTAGKISLLIPPPQAKSIDTRLAWLAGIVDGEGSISLNRIRTKDRQGRPYWYARFTVRVANTDPAMLNEFMAIADLLGVRYFCSTYKNNPRRNEKPCPGVVVATKSHVTALLTALFPYLITKQARAELTLRAIAHRQSTRTAGGRYMPLENDTTFVGYVDEMSRLNRRGREMKDGI